MFRTLLASAGLLLLVPAVASAAPFGELPFQPVAGSATCLRATGTPGELVRQSERTVQLVTASPAGLTAGATLAADGIRGCAETASWAGGGGLVAFAVSSDLEDERWARVYVREPGGGWGEPVDVIAPEEQPFSSSLATAASERGDALVALASVTSDARAHVRVVRRLPGGAFGVTETLHSRRTGEPFPPIVHAGLSASGEAIVLWTVEPVKDERSGDERSARGRAERELWAAIAPPGAPFGAPKLIDPIASSVPYDLTVAPDGRALVVFGSGDQLVAAERPPGGVFGYPFTVADTIDEFGSAPTSVLRPDGAAIIAWAGLTDGTMSVRTRTAPGIFGPAITLGRAHRIERPVFASLTRLIDTALSGLQGEFGLGGAPPDARGANPRAALGAERSGDERSARGRGRVLLTWGQVHRSDGVWRVLPRGALLDFAGGQREPLAFGGSLRNVDSLTPLTLADGSRAVAWTDNNGKLGRVHLGHEGSPDRPEPAAPRLQVSMTGSRTIRGESPLVLRATCDAACDIYAQLADHEEVVDELSLPAAGSRRIVLPPLLGPIVPLRGGPVWVLLRSSAPGGHTVTARTLTLHLRRAKAVLPSPPLGLTAVRDGDEIVARWRTAKPESPHGYSVLGLDGEPVTGGDVPGKAKRASFVVGLADGRRQAEEATVLRAGEETSETARTTVPVQG